MRCGTHHYTLHSVTFLSHLYNSSTSSQHHTMALHSALWAMLILSVSSIDSVWTQFYDCCCDEYGELYGIVAMRAIVDDVGQRFMIFLNVVTTQSAPIESDMAQNMWWNEERSQKRVRNVFFGVSLVDCAWIWMDTQTTFTSPQERQKNNVCSYWNKLQIFLRLLHVVLCPVVCVCVLSLQTQTSNASFLVFSMKCIVWIKDVHGRLEYDNTDWSGQDYLDVQQEWSTCVCICYMQTQTHKKCLNASYILHILAATAAAVVADALTTTFSCIVFVQFAFDL